MARYVPREGDLVAVNFDPQSGHEQKGRRPALVISRSLFNKHTGMAIACPITNTFRRSPFHVKIAEESSVTGYIMVDQIKSMDYTSRRIKFIEKAPPGTLDEVLSVLDPCIYPPS
jgi:mRNA interferase MazF